MIANIPTLANALAFEMEAVTYQVTGMAVVFCCLGLLCVILTISGNVAQNLEAKRKAQAEAARAALAAAAPKPAPAPAPTDTKPTPEEVATVAAGIYGAARSSVTPEVVAAIAAAVKVTVGAEARILDISPVTADYARSGRSSIMNSRFPVRG